MSEKSLYEEKKNEIMWNKRKNLAKPRTRGEQVHEGKDGGSRGHGTRPSGTGQTLTLYTRGEIHIYSYVMIKVYIIIKILEHYKFEQFTVCPRTDVSRRKGRDNIDKMTDVAMFSGDQYDQL